MASLMLATVLGMLSVSTSRRAATEAAEAKLIASRQASAIERLAITQDKVLDLAERRHAAATSQSAPPIEPEVDWDIEYVAGDMYRLRNLGTGRATGVSFDDSTLPSACVLPPGGETIGPLRSYDFYMADEIGSTIPGELAISSDQLGNSVVRVPTRS